LEEAERTAIQDSMVEATRHIPIRFMAGVIDLLNQ
jgi:hypothetical protein